MMQEKFIILKPFMYQGNVVYKKIARVTPNWIYTLSIGNGLDFITFFQNLFKISMSDMLPTYVLDHIVYVRIFNLWHMRTREVINIL